MYRYRKTNINICLSLSIYLPTIFLLGYQTCISNLAHLKQNSIFSPKSTSFSCPILVASPSTWLSVKTRRRHWILYPAARSDCRFYSRWVHCPPSLLLPSLCGLSRPHALSCRWLQQLPDWSPTALAPTPPCSSLFTRQRDGSFPAMASGKCKVLPHLVCI